MWASRCTPAEVVALADAAVPLTRKLLSELPVPLPPMRAECRWQVYRKSLQQLQASAGRGVQQCSLAVA